MLLKHLGEFSDGLSSKLKIAQDNLWSSENRHIVDEIVKEIGALLKNKLFSKKAQLQTFFVDDRLYINVDEVKTICDVTETETYGDKYVKTDDSISIADYNLQGLRLKPKHKDGYVMTSTVTTYPCDAEIQCPTCNMSGLCQNCNGV